MKYQKDFDEYKGNDNDMRAVFVGIAKALIYMKKWDKLKELAEDYDKAMGFYMLSMVKK